MTEYDVVVIGGGPAGLSCAVMLQKKGFSTCVLEKKAYPRDKLCGGLITAKTYSLLLELFDGNADLLDGLCFETVKKVSLWDSDSCKARVSVTHEFRIVERKALDRTLKDLYVRNGGTVYDGEAGPYDEDGTMEEEAVMVRVGKGGANMRDVMDLNAKPVRILHAGEKVLVYSVVTVNRHPWAVVLAGDTFGYVSASYLDWDDEDDDD